VGFGGHAEGIQNRRNILLTVYIKMTAMVAWGKLLHLYTIIIDPFYSNKLPSIIDYLT
jgi:hypothetical protein